MAYRVAALYRAVGGAYLRSADAVVVVGRPERYDHGEIAVFIVGAQPLRHTGDNCVALGIEHLKLVPELILLLCGRNIAAPGHEVVGGKCRRHVAVNDLGDEKIQLKLGVILI